MATTEPSEIERPDLSELDDGALVQLARDGVHDAYAALYSRHAHPAQRLARHLGMRDEAEDVVAESFAQVLELMRRGKGPETSFRAYLFTTIRHDSARRAKARQKLVPTDDDSAIDTMVGLDAGQLDAFEASAIRAAYTSLPARWRTVLWQVEVERRKPQDLAPVLGLSPNGVSALAYRARSALREAYLKQHLRSASATGRKCVEVRDRLPAMLGGRLPKRRKQAALEHLVGCAECRAVLRELEVANATVRGVERIG
jgi:RNA polymerase sigma factor (sigma-70 family)